MGMPLKGGPLGGGHVPDLDGHVMGRRRQRLAIRAERHGLDTGCRFARLLILFGMPLEGGSLFVGGQVPELDVAVVHRGQGLAIRAECHGLDKVEFPP